MPQSMGVADEPAQRAGVEPAAACAEEERVLRAARELGTGLADVARQPVRRLLTERHGAFLAALAADVHELLVEVDVGEVEVDRLAASQSGGVDELDQGAVAERERAVAVERIEDAVDLADLRRVREPSRATGSGTRAAPSVNRSSERTAASLRAIVAGASLRGRARPSSAM